MRPADRILRGAAVEKAAIGLKVRESATLAATGGWRLAMPGLIASVMDPEPAGGLPTRHPHQDGRDRGIAPNCSRNGVAPSLVIRNHA